MKPLIALFVASLLSGCAVTSSTGILKGLPSDDDAVYRCYAVAYAYVPMFIYLSDENVPKRAVLRISVNEGQTDRSALRHKAKLRASPRHLDFAPTLRGNLLTFQVKDSVTHQSWTLRFRKQPDGQFKLVAAEGDFRQ